MQILSLNPRPRSIDLLSRFTWGKRACTVALAVFQNSYSSSLISGFSDRDGGCKNLIFMVDLSVHHSFLPSLCCGIWFCLLSFRFSPASRCIYTSASISALRFSKGRLWPDLPCDDGHSRCTTREFSAGWFGVRGEASVSTGLFKPSHCKNVLYCAVGILVMFHWKCRQCWMDLLSFSRNWFLGVRRIADQCWEDHFNVQAFGSGF